MRRCIVLLILVVVAGCASADRSLFPPRAGEPDADIVVFSNHWHTGIIVPYADLAPSMQKQLAAFQNYPYLCIGWGDTDFFRSAHITAWTAVRALFFSRGTVLLVLGLPVAPEEAFENSVVVYRIHASRAGYDRMLSSLDASFQRANGQVIDRGMGAEGFSAFFQGVGHYSALRTCNVWTADALRAAGLPIAPQYALSADNLEYQIAEIPGILRNGRLIPPAKLKPPLPISRGSRRGI